MAVVLGNMEGYRPAREGQQIDGGDGFMYVRVGGNWKVAGRVPLAQVQAPKPVEKPVEEPLVKAKPIALEHYFNTAVYNRVHKVGLEVEGGWDTTPTGHKIEGDVSVFRNGFKGPLAGAAVALMGEIKSPPMDLIQVEPWMKKCSPKYIDDTCGLHLHMSFKKAHYYSRLMVEEYPATLLHYLGVWAKANLPADHCIWDRLAGKCKYCRNVFWPDLQVVKDHSQREHNVDREGNRKGHRYTSVNYCWGMGFETLEIRVLPMMPTLAQSVDVIHECVRITNAFLAATKKDPRFRVRADMEDGRPYVDKRVIHV